MKKIYIPFLLALAFTACQEGNITPEAPAVSDEMSFNVITPGLQTKVTNGAFEATDVIGLYVTDYVNEITPMPLQISGNRANNSQVTFDGAVWTPVQTIFWGNGKSDVYAYYPYFETVTDVNELYFEVATDQTNDGYEASDFLWAKAEGVRQTDGAVNLEMKHLMSKLTVKIVAGEDYIGSLPEDATVHLHSTVTNVNIDLENGAVVKDPYSGVKSIKMKNLGIRTIGGEKAVVYEAIVVPQMLENSVPLLEINSKSVSYLLEDPFNFRPGVAYTYTATLNASTTAIKVEIGCEIEDWNNAGGDSGEGEEGGEGDGNEGEEDTKTYTDLSVAGTANCYLIQDAGDYKFKSVIGNTSATVGNVETVEVLWESFGTEEMPNIGDLIASVSYKNGYIRFSTPENFRDGNAVIAAKNSKGTILWSWHIWCAEEGYNGQIYYNDAGTMMDRNLGATSATPGDVGALGLLYQWGRKDPFMGAATVKSGGRAVATGIWDVASGGTPVNAEANPMTFYTDMTMPNVSWASMKTAYDPCPAGWRVPEGGENGVWAKAFGASNSVSLSFDRTNWGINLTGIYGDADAIWYPEAGTLEMNSGALRIQTSSSSWGGVTYCYWSCTPSATSDFYSFYFAPDEIQMSKTKPRGDGCPVRCVQEGVVEVKTPKDLSIDGTANSYIVSEAGSYKFTPTKGNSSESVGEIASVEVLWETFGTNVKPNVGDLVRKVSYKNGEVIFQTADTFHEGNAVIAAKDASGTILWSWHIWLTDEPEGQEYYNNAGTMMDRNLGATSAIPGKEAHGLLYQWGRKDPFLPFAQSTIIWPSPVSSVSFDFDSGLCNVPYATANPTTFITYNDLNYDWCYSGVSSADDTRWQLDKTIYDPCPAGWRVPDGGSNGVWSKALGSSSNFTGTGTNAGSGVSTNGLEFSGKFGDDSTIWYPCSGYRDYRNGSNQGYASQGYYWSVSPKGHAAYCLGFNNVMFSANPSNDNYRACGLSVRCIKE